MFGRGSGFKKFGTGGESESEHVTPATISRYHGFALTLSLSLNRPYPSRKATETY